MAIASSTALITILGAGIVHAQEVELPTIDVHSTSSAPLQQVPQIGKTGTRIDDIPASVAIVPAEIVREQGGTDLKAAIRNVSGIDEGGSSSYGFFDRFQIRGLDPRIYEDGFSDGDQLNGIPQSLNGVERIEIYKGPGSALFGSGPPGGTINIVHFAPSPVPTYGVGAYIGSFGTVSTNLHAGGPTTVPGFNYRIDGLAEHADGFRGHKSADYELRPEFGWNNLDHVGTLSFDIRHIERTPDAYGLIYFNGGPINVPRDTKYSTPFSKGNQDVFRAAATDAWSATDYLTVNNRISVLYRDLDLLRNSGGKVTGIAFTNRQLRHQHDNDATFDYQFEPVWTFDTGSVGHKLLTGLEAQYQTIITHRETAALPNITNIFAPVVPEMSTAGLVFQRTAALSGSDDSLSAAYLSAYATDQIDVTDKLKVRVGARQDWWNMQMTPFDAAGRINGDTGLPFVPGVTLTRQENPVSWNAGVLYHVLPGVSPFVGVSRSYLSNFNSESTDGGIHAPESALQYEGGIKFSALQDRVTLTTSVFDVQRTNVFHNFTDPSTGITSGVFNDQRTRGYEADLVVYPTPQWRILANATAQHAELTNNPSSPSATGNIPTGVPTSMFNFWTSYDFSIGGLDGFQIGGGAQYRSRIYADDANTQLLPNYVIFDAALSYKQPHWDMAIGVKNITDKTYFSTALGAGAAINDPRTFYLRANYRWD